MAFNNIRMGVKLPVAFVTLSLAVTLVISVLGYRDFRASLLAQKQEMLQIITAERANSIQSWLNQIDQQLKHYADYHGTIDAVKAFQSTFGLLMPDPVSDLQIMYIDENPNPTGEKDALLKADASIPYNFQHETYHPAFRSIKDRLHLYDVFLIDPDGNIIYSVYKERDFATNLDTGPYRESGLADAFRAARTGQRGESYFSDFAPYAPSAGAPASFLSSPIFDTDGTLLGVFAIQLPDSDISEIVARSDGLGKTGEITLIGDDLRARSTSRFEGRHTIFEPVQPNSLITEASFAEATDYTDAANLVGEASMGAARPVTFAGAHWLILGEIELHEVYEAALRQRNKVFGIIVLAMMGVGVCGYLISKSFSAPLTQVANAMRRISARDYAVTLPDLNRKDEIGEISRGLAGVGDRLKEFDEKLEAELEFAQAQQFAVEELQTGLQRLADQDFSLTLHNPFSADYEPLRQNYNETITQLGTTIADLKSFAVALQEQINQIGHDSSELSQRTENQASTLEETAAALDQITQNIAESSSDLRAAETLIFEADNQVKQGRAVVENTTHAMDEIEKSSQEIGSIIRVVDDIAFQTNLLALNAGVEAARAGDAGRGFAVVASEVRQLAMRSAEAVAQIKGLIETSTDNVEKGVTLVRNTESVLLEIVQRMEGISTSISSVTASADEQSTNIGEINTGVNNLDRVTQQNAMMVESSNTSVQALSQQAANLTEILAAFKTSNIEKIHKNQMPAVFESRRPGPSQAA